MKAMPELTRYAYTAVLLLLPSFLLAQSASFDIASVKPANPDSRGTMIRMLPGGQLKITNMPLKNLIAFAYDVQPFQISGGPGWMNSERFDIDGKMEGAPDPQDGPPSRPNEAEMRRNGEAARQHLQ